MCPGQRYWTLWPLTGKRECANFSTRLEAEKHDSLIKHRLKFDRESFGKAEEEDSRAMSFESLYLLYLKEKQFDRKSLPWQMDCIRPALKRFGTKAVPEIKKRRDYGDHGSHEADRGEACHRKKANVRAQDGVSLDCEEWVRADARLPEAPFRAV